MDTHALTPVVRALLLCREIHQDARSGEYILIGPRVDFLSHQYPCIATVSAFAQLTSTHGSYMPSLQLRDAEDQVIWREEMNLPLECHDPLRVWTIALHNMGMWVPRPGQYEVALLFNGEVAARNLFRAAFPAPPVAGPEGGG